MLKGLNFIKVGLEFIKELVIVVLVALIFINFIISHNEIPTSSMVSTINIGDHVLTNMIPYYYRNPRYKEVITFNQGNEVWVKRVIGLPGDVIDIRDGEVYRNGQKLDESEYLDEGVTSEPLGENPVAFPYTVPTDHYFLMGDNRMVSKDCRYIGAISREQIKGKVMMKIYPFDQIGELK